MYQISAATREGTDVLMKDIQNYVDQVKLTEQREREEAEQAAKLAEQLNATTNESDETVSRSSGLQSPLRPAATPLSAAKKPNHSEGSEDAS